HPELAGDRLRFGDLLRFQALAFQHVLEVRVAAEIELICPVEPNTPFAEPVGQHAMDDGSAYLALAVLPYQRQAALLETSAPFRPGGDEHRYAVDEGTARFERFFGVPQGSA